MSLKCAAWSDFEDLRETSSAGSLKTLVVENAAGFQPHHKSLALHRPCSPQSKHKLPSSGALLKCLPVFCLWVLVVFVSWFTCFLCISLFVFPPALKSHTSDLAISISSKIDHLLIRVYICCVTGPTVPLCENSLVLSDAHRTGKPPCYPVAPFPAKCHPDSTWCTDCCWWLSLQVMICPALLTQPWQCFH